MLSNFSPDTFRFHKTKMTPMKRQKIISVQLYNQFIKLVPPRFLNNWDKSLCGDFYKISDST